MTDQQKPVLPTSTGARKHGETPTWIPCGLPGSTEPMHGLGDLVVAMGGDETSFIGKVLELVPKAQNNPENLAALRRGWPHLVRAWELWMAMRPTPTRDQLHAALAADPEALVVAASSDVKPMMAAAEVAATAALERKGVVVGFAAELARAALVAAVPIVALGTASAASTAFNEAIDIVMQQVAWRDAAIAQLEQSNAALVAEVAAAMAEQCEHLAGETPTAAASSDPNLHACAARSCRRWATVGSRWCCRPCADAWEANPRFELHAHSDRCDETASARGAQSIAKAGV